MVVNVFLGYSYPPPGCNNTNFYYCIIYTIIDNYPGELLKLIKLIITFNISKSHANRNVRNNLSKQNRISDGNLKDFNIIPIFI